MDARIEIPTGHAGLLLALNVSDYPGSSRIYLHACLRRRRDYQALASAGTTDGIARLLDDALSIDGCLFHMKPKPRQAAIDWLRSHGVTVRDCRKPAKAAA